MKSLLIHTNKLYFKILIITALFYASFVPLAWSASPYPVYAKKGMVSSSSLLASQIGAKIMKRGGNAVDAAVATAFALAVTHPVAGNIGGGGFAVIRMPDGTITTNDHREKAPGRSSRDMFLDAKGNPIPKLAVDSHLASGVPGSVAGLLDIHKKYGNLSRKAILKPAIRLAKRGFPLSRSLAQAFKKNNKYFANYPASLAKFTKKDGSYYAMGDVWKQPKLAETLTLIYKLGRDGFYKGVTADMIVAEMQRGEGAGKGLISKQDLERYTSVWREPVKGTYRGYEIYGMPPPSSGGILLIQMLNMLEPISKKDIGGPGSALNIHLIIEAERRAFADRAMYFGDPDFTKVPVKQLINKGYARNRFKNVNIDKATRSRSIRPGNIGRMTKESTQTTHLSTMDAEGWAVSLTTTLNRGYGSKIVVTGAGFLLNNEMDDFSIKPGTPNSFQVTGGKSNAIEPYKRMLSSMTPTIVQKNGKPVLVTGSPGGPSIITTVLQVLMNFIDHRMSLSNSVAAAKFHHQWLPDRVAFEPFGFSPDTLRILNQMGHKVAVRRDTWGSANSILWQDGLFHGVSDPRRATGASVGY